MASSISAGMPQITIVNGTRFTLWVAIYKRSPLRPNEPPVAWDVVCPPPRGKTIIFIPRDYQVCARYSFEPENPWRPVHQTNVLQVPHAPACAGFVIQGVSSQDRRTWGAVLTPGAKSPGWYQVRIVNHFNIGVWGHIRQEGRDIVSPRILPPMSAWTEGLDSSFYIAVLPLPRAAGDRLPSSETVLTEIMAEAGETFRIQGGPYKGFKLSKCLEGSTAGDKKPKAKARPKAKGKTPKRAAAKKPAGRRKAGRGSSSLP